MVMSFYFWNPREPDAIWEVSVSVSKKSNPSKAQYVGQRDRQREGEAAGSESVRTHPNSSGWSYRSSLTSCRNMEQAIKNNRRIADLHFTFVSQWPRCYIYISPPGGPQLALKSSSRGQYCLHFSLPTDADEGNPPNVFCLEDPERVG